jgi:transposase
LGRSLYSSTVTCEFSIVTCEKVWGSSTLVAQWILQIHQASRATYGAPRIHAELTAQGTRCGCKRVARLMRLLGIVGCHRRRPRLRTTRRDPAARPAPDLVQRAFVATAPNDLWVSEAAAQLDPEQLVFVHESSTHIALMRLYGWAPHDRRATGSVPRNCGKNTTLVAALTPNGLHVPWMIEGAMDTSTFVWYITEQLAPTLRPGQVVVLDNLSVHKAARIHQALQASHCQLLFLPPYSPDFTPIEQAFSKIKAILLRLGARTRETLWEAVRVVVEAIAPADAVAWFAHAGYVLPAQLN